ncbi:MAG TPA: CDP-glucose 4,6-dehydratase, partial [Planctomycetota bacterium]|nr:CDP-glucose 4,6-dehydratase [Planctomycetota bacterium]
MTAFDGVFAGERVLVTGDTGFKGAWLAWWLHGLGAKVSGLALPPPTDPSLFELAALGSVIEHHEVDVRDAEALSAAFERVRPRLVLHLAAQSLVRASYDDPLGTLDTNVMGTAHLLEAVRASCRPCAVLVVTSDKCYANRERRQGYREEDPLGGKDPYSASKGAAEIVVASWRSSFFPPDRLDAHGVALASARAGNVIGPGDWARDRLVPDAIGALGRGEPVRVRNPQSTRPWQHVLEPLAGYLWLGRRLLAGDAGACEAWNFGPHERDTRPVRELVEALVAAWGGGRWEAAPEPGAPPEAGLLQLAIDKAAARLGWAPVWTLDESVRRTATGYRRLLGASSP